MRRLPAIAGVVVNLVGAAATLGTLGAPLPAEAASPGSTARARYVVVAASTSAYAALQARAARDGARVHELHGTRTFAVDATAAVADRLRTSPLAAAVVRDHVETLIRPDQPQSPQRWSGPAGQHPVRRMPVSLPADRRGPGEDPASALPGLMWNQRRVRLPLAHAVTYGRRALTVAVADTGLDYRHAELRGRVSRVVDFTRTEDPPLCKTSRGIDDPELAAGHGVPDDNDFNGHGTWIGGSIAAALDGRGINGIAPKVRLVSLKISQWCGQAYDSEILAAFQYAAKHRIDVVNISFGGYLDRREPAQDAIYRQYVAAVAEARAAGTLIVGAAGNEHLRIGAGGRVLSHGPLTVPGTAPADFKDHFGRYQVPGGIAGVVDVSATGNVVAAPSATCDPSTTGVDATCKPATDAHQATGVGRRDQLAYYSNYGPRIDIAAPGGVRRFNVPSADRGGTAGFPVTADRGFRAFAAFSITSNYAREIPCYTISDPSFPAGQCYSTIQGTSMAAPHVSAAAALVISARPWLRHRPDAVVDVLKDSARADAVNRTKPLSATDTSPGDRTGLACPTGYCHLGGRPISSWEAYGAGLLDTYAAVR